MPSKTSYAKHLHPPLLVHNLRQFALLWVSCTVLCLQLPFQVWAGYHTFQQDLAQALVDGNAAAQWARSAEFSDICARNLADLFAHFGAIATCIYAFLCVAVLFSYLFQSRSALGMHALPLTRDSIFITQCATGVLFALIPLFITGILTACAMVATDSFLPQVLLLFLGQFFAMFLFHFGIALICAMLTGQLWAMGFFYAICNYITIATYAIYDILASIFLYGYYNNPNSERLAKFCTPTLYLSQCVTIDLQNPTPESLRFILSYALTGLVLLGMAWLLFRTRALEHAGEVVTVRALRPLFFICAGVYSGYYTLLFFVAFLDITSVACMPVWLVFGCCIGYFGAQMLLEKSLCVLCKRHLLQCTALCTMLLACLACLQYDVFRFANYVPEADDVSAVSITMPAFVGAVDLGFTSYTVDDAENIARALAFQERLIATRPSTAQNPLQALFGSKETTTPCANSTVTSTADTTATGNVTATGNAPENTGAQNHTAPSGMQFVYTTVPVTFSYTLTDGNLVQRQYLVTVDPDTVQDASHPAAYADAFIRHAVDIDALFATYRTQLYVNAQGNDTAFSASANSAEALATIDALYQDITEENLPPTVLELDIEHDDHLDMVFFHAENIFISVTPLSGSHLADCLATYTAQG